jgi:hypothetical protein
MPEPPNLSNVADAEGIAKIILMLFGAGGFLKVSVALINKVWDRFIKQDEHQHLARDRFEQVVWEKLKDEEQLTDTLRKEYQSVREQLYSSNTAQALMGLELDRLREECAELRAENEKLRHLRLKFNQSDETESGVL